MPCSVEGGLSDGEKLNEVTRVACDLRTILRRHNIHEDELTHETRQWILEHDKWDARRVAQEQASGERDRIRQAGLDKLTLDERRALGL